MKKASKHDPNKPRKKKSKASKKPTTGKLGEVEKKKEKKEKAVEEKKVKEAVMTTGVQGGSGSLRVEKTQPSDDSAHRKQQADKEKRKIKKEDKEKKKSKEPKVKPGPPGTEKSPTPPEKKTKSSLDGTTPDGSKKKKEKEEKAPMTPEAKTPETVGPPMMDVKKEDSKRGSKEKEEPVETKAEKPKEVIIKEGLKYGFDEMKLESDRDNLDEKPEKKKDGSDPKKPKDASDPKKLKDGSDSPKKPKNGSDIKKPKDSSDHKKPKVGSDLKNPNGSSDPKKPKDGSDSPKKPKDSSDPKKLKSESLKLKKTQSTSPLNIAAPIVPGPPGKQIRKIEPDPNKEKSDKSCGVKIVEAERSDLDQPPPEPDFVLNHGDTKVNRIEIKKVDLDLVGRTGMYLERIGMSAERKQSFDWIAYNRHDMNNKQTDFSKNLAAALSDIGINKNLLMRTIIYLKSHGQITPSEMDKVLKEIQAVKGELISFSQVSIFLKTHCETYQQTGSKEVAT
ncbi:hypothetical protein L3Y34_015964 [Caenorhabditis briggsae]|nr:hypothetical protein L3Y34_015964 [Caenorhabditis briggsae]